MGWYYYRKPTINKATKPGVIASEIFWLESSSNSKDVGSAGGRSGAYVLAKESAPNGKDVVIETLKVCKKIVGVNRGRESETS